MYAENCDLIFLFTGSKVRAKDGRGKWETRVCMGGLGGRSGREMERKRWSDCCREKKGKRKGCTERIGRLDYCKG